MIVTVVMSADTTDDKASDTIVVTSIKFFTFFSYRDSISNCLSKISSGVILGYLACIFNVGFYNYGMNIHKLGRFSPGRQLGRDG